MADCGQFCFNMRVDDFSYMLYFIYYMLLYIFILLLLFDRYGNIVVNIRHYLIYALSQYLRTSTANTAILIQLSPSSTYLPNGYNLLQSSIQLVVRYTKYIYILIGTIILLTLNIILVESYVLLIYCLNGVFILVNYVLSLYWISYGKYICEDCFCRMYWVLNDCWGFYHNFIISYIVAYLLQYFAIWLLFIFILCYFASLYAYFPQIPIIVVDILL